MAIVNTNVVVSCQGNGTGATPVVLISPTGTVSDPQTATVYNPGVPTLFWGAPGVTPTTGTPIIGGASRDFTNLVAGDVIYGICSSVTTTVYVTKNRS